VAREPEIGMRVLLIDRAIGNWYSIGLANGLRAHGIDVLIAGPAKFEDSVDVVPVYPRGGVRGQRLAKLYDTAPGVAKMLNVLRQFRPDVLHVQWASALDLLYVRLAQAISKPRVAFTVHNPAPRGDSDIDSWQPRLLPLTDVLITHGPELREQLRGLYPELAGRIHVIEHGNYEHAARRLPARVARDRLGLPTSGPLFVFLGQIRPFKGVEILLYAYAAYVKRGHAGALAIVGTATHGKYLADLRSLGARLGIEPHWIVSENHLPHETLNLAASAATQIVLPFLEASQSGSLVFAMTHGRCVVSTTVGAVPRTLAGKGLLVPPGNSTALAAALERAAVDPRGCEALGTRARQYAVDNLSWQRVAAETIKAYAG
jgi:glycosyltransferase involved in cell wall biosynthesis